MTARITRQKRKRSNQSSLHSQAYYIHALQISLFSLLFFLCSLRHPFPHQYYRTPKQRNAIVQYILVLTVLGAVAVETQGLVGHELPTHGVKSSPDGDTVSIASAQEERMAWHGRARNSCV